MNLKLVKDALRHTLNLDFKPSILVEITASNGCNKKCSYCFEKNKKLKMNKNEEIRQLKLLKQLCLEFDSSKFDRLKLSFWGGEPMLNYQFVQKVFDQTSQFDFVDWHIFSNGTLSNEFKTLICDEKFSSKLQHGRLSVQISFDGEPHHSLKRGYSPSEFNDTLQLFCNKNILFNFKGTLAIDSLELMPQCWDSYYDLFKKLNTNIYWCPAIDSFADLSKIDLEKWKNILIQIAKKEFSFIKNNGRPLLSWFNDTKRFCDIRFSTHMHSDGNFYLCHGAPYIEDNNKKGKFITGNTASVTSIMDVISSSTINLDDQPNECKLCGATYCGACHINVVDENDIKNDWLKCIVRENKGRCEMMKTFGKINRMLRLALASDSFFLNDK